MNGEFWQLQLIKKSLKKKERLKLLEKNLKIEPASISLDLGCAQGILSYFLRQKGGLWVSSDQDFINLKTSQSLLKDNIVQTGSGFLPFKSEIFDKVVSLDYLEHQEDDDLCLGELHRILKKGGQLILATPRTGKLFLLHRLRTLIGMKLEFYGHKREGYSLTDLKRKLENVQFTFIKHKTFARFITEFLELLLNFFYIKFFSKKTQYSLRDGHIRPSTADEFTSKKITFKVYSFFYPIVWFISRLDKLIFFQRGYGLMVWAKKID